ncbi:MAG: cytochrome D1 [Acidobacteria bacterium]|nr:cytochrome D1 [Acidobacteriota bacterium]
MSYFDDSFRSWARLLLSALALSTVIAAEAREVSVPDTPDVPSVAAAAPAEAPAAEAPSAEDTGAEKEGITVSMEVERLFGAEGALTEGDTVLVKFKIADTATGAPMSSLYPAAWMDRIPAGALVEQESCSAKVSNFLGGSLFSQPEVNLNVYYVVALNDDASITVVDPLFGFGTTKLLALVQLEANGEDWVMSPDERRLYVSVPDAGKVTVVNTETWKIAADLEVGGRPSRLELTADGRHLWATDDSERPGSGVLVLDTESLSVEKRIATAPGRHDLVLGSDELHAFVTNLEAGTVSILDARTLAKVADVATGPSPRFIDYSSTGRAAYVVDDVAGTVTIIDGESREASTRIEAKPGLGMLRFAPDGRYGVMVNPENDRIYVIDAARQRIVQTGVVEEGPDQVTFTDELAYIRHRDNELVIMVPLGELGREGAPIPIVDFPGGQAPPGKGSASRAVTIVQAPGAPAVLVANPADRIIYFYKEGMAAPMGSFQNYSRQPRAVLVVDRSLEERRPGEYETAVTLRRPGTYDVAFFLDAPRLVHCFSLDVAADPQLEKERLAQRMPVNIETLKAEHQVKVGEPVELRFRLTDPQEGTPVDGLEDLRVVAFRGPGLWQQRSLAQGEGGGVYSTVVTPPEAGIYYVFLGARSLGLEVQDSTFVVFEATLPEEAADGADSAQASLR